jgi:hypothetical protein
MVPPRKIIKNTLLTVLYHILETHAQLGFFTSTEGRSLNNNNNDFASLKLIEMTDGAVVQESSLRIA